MVSFTVNPARKAGCYTSIACAQSRTTVSTIRVHNKSYKIKTKKLKNEHPEIYDSIVYSHELAYKFACKQKESFDDFEVELTPGMFTGQKTIPVEKAGT